MDRVKANAIVEAEESVKKALGAVELLEKTTASELWLKELDDFEAGWVTMMKARVAVPAKAKVKAKPAVRKAA